MTLTRFLISAVPEVMNVFLQVCSALREPSVKQQHPSVLVVKWESWTAATLKTAAKCAEEGETSILWSSFMQQPFCSQAGNTNRVQNKLYLPLITTMFSLGFITFFIAFSSGCCYFLGTWGAFASHYWKTHALFVFYESTKHQIYSEFSDFLLDY